MIVMFFFFKKKCLASSNETYWNMFIKKNSLNLGSLRYF